jgi:hypothetical protein
MTDFFVMDEGFESDCIHAGEMILDGLLDGSERTAFHINDMEDEIFETVFIESVGRFIGGYVSGDCIYFRGKVIRLWCDCSIVVDDCVKIVVFCDIVDLPLARRRIYLPGAKLPLRCV